MDFQPNQQPQPNNQPHHGDDHGHHGDQHNHHDQNQQMHQHAHPEQPPLGQPTPAATPVGSGRPGDEMFCVNCGQSIKRGTAFCMHCGAQVGHAATVHAQPTNNLEARDKVVAILLAVFVGFFAWLYTYKKDMWKFWLNLGLSIVTLGLWAMIAWIWVVIDVAIKPDAYYRNYPN